MTEIWKQNILDDINTCYCISSMGNVRNDKNGRIMSLQKNSSGYIFCALYINKQQKNPYIHQLVATAFKDNPDKLNIVHHIDAAIL